MNEVLPQLIDLKAPVSWHFLAASFPATALRLALFRERGCLKA